MEPKVSDSFYVSRKTALDLLAIARRGFYYEVIKTFENIKHKRPLEEGLDPVDGREVVACVVLPSLLATGAVKEGDGGYYTEYECLEFDPSEAHNIKIGIRAAAEKVANRSLSIPPEMANDAFIIGDADKDELAREFSALKGVLVRILELKPSSIPENNVHFELCYVATREPLCNSKSAGAGQ